ncbi:MAG: NTP transferase domain-containing protein [Bacteroidaceae bacterium]|nr:NTP transferase domain-containing protein [Bacteroidaceae bacterium]
MIVEKQCIKLTATVLDALAALDTLSGSTLVLFATNDDNQVVGTITDGDIRRALLKGAQLTTSVCEVMHSSFSYLSTTERDHTNTIHEFRKHKITVVPLLNETHNLVKVYNFKEQSTILPVDAVLMAGGKGERLRPLTDKTPKPLLPVGDKAIIDHNIDRLISYGVENINVTVNYLKEKLEEHFRTPHKNVQIRTVSEPTFLGTMGSVKFVEDIHNDTILVMNSDIFTDIDYEDFYLHFQQNNADMSVAAVPYTVSIPYGIMELNGHNIQGMVEKPRYTYYANAGVYLLKREVLNLIPQGEFYNATDLISDLVKAGKSVIRYPINGTWIDIGNPQEYQKANDLASHTRL